MDGRLDTPDPMKGLLLLVPVVIVAACGKGELDPAGLSDNPFDPDYKGPTVFTADSTYLQTVLIGAETVIYQAMAFHVQENLFTSPAAYSVQIRDQVTGLVSVLEPNPPNSNRFTYLIGAPQPNVARCFDLSLYNNLSAARADGLCVTLQQ